MAKDGTTGPVSNMDGGTFKSSEEVRMEDARDLTQSEAIIDELGEGLGKLLVDAGFVTILSIQTATDEDLLAISGIGKSKLAEIRETNVGAKSLANMTMEELVPAPDIPPPEAETPDEAGGYEYAQYPTPLDPDPTEKEEEIAEVGEPAPEVIEETLEEEGDSLEILDEAFEREADLPTEEAEKAPEPEGSLASSVIFDDSVVPSPADLEAQGEIIPELADLKFGPGEPKEYPVSSEDEDILPELADLEVGPRAQPGMAMMPTVIEPSGVSSRIARIQQTVAEQAVEDARVAEAVRKNAIRRAEKAAEKAKDEAEQAALEVVKETRIAEVSEVLREAEVEDIINEPAATPEGALARSLAEGEIAGDAPIVHAQLDSEVIGEGTVSAEQLEGLAADIEETVDEVTAEVEELGPEEVGGPEPDDSEEPTSE